MRKRPCLLFACIFLTGIAFQRYQWKPLCIVPVIFLGVEVYHGIKAVFDKGRKLLRMTGRSLLLLSAFFLGVWNMKTQDEFRNVYLSKIEDGDNAVLWGELIKIEKTEYGSRLILTDCYVSLQEANVPCNEVMVYASSDHYRVGQIYQIKGKFQLFERARNFGNFDSALFYQSQKIDFCVYEEESILLDENENILRDELLNLKLHMKAVYQQSLEEGAAGFYTGMVLGDKSSLQDRTKDLFALGGISHILAISGLHMSIIGRGFYKYLRKCRMGFLSAGILAGITLLSYCFMVGNGVSAIRAVGMMLLYFLAQWLGRSYDMLNALGVMVIVLLWDNPFLLEYSGFQFSIAALIGVGFVGQTLSQQVKAGTKGIAASLWASIGITLSTLPVVASCYYEIPLYSLLVNSLLLPILTPVFVLALVGGLIGCVVPAIGQIVLIPCGWLFFFYEWVCRLVGQLPFANVITGKPDMETIVFYYSVLFLGCIVMLYRMRCLRDKVVEQDRTETKQMDKVKQTDRVKQVDMAQKQTEIADEQENLKCSNKIFIKKYTLPITLTALCCLILLYPKASKSEIVFLDVGQGDGIYISSEDGTAFFIDGGSSDVKQAGTYRILPFLKAYGVKNIDYWFVSHADNDHISGLLEVIEEGYQIGYLVISDKMPKDENQQKLLVKAQEDGIEVISMKAGEQICSEHIEISCLYPWETAADRNEQSMALLVEFLDDKKNCVFSGLFTGDMSSEGELQLLENHILDDVDLFKAAHHGSKYSNSQGFLEVIQPELCVVSCGVDNSYGHPHEEVLGRLQEVECGIFNTAEGGQVTIIVDEIVQISCWKTTLSQ